MCSVTQSCLTLWDPMDCSLAGSSVHGIFQARILEQVAISHFRGSFWHRYQIHASAGRFFIAAPPGKSCTMPTGLYNYLHKCPSNSIIQSICYQTFTEHIQCARHCPSLWGSMFHKTNKPLSELAYSLSLYPFRAKTRGHRNQEPTSVSHHPRSCHRIWPRKYFSGKCSVNSS